MLSPPSPDLFNGSSSVPIQDEKVFEFPYGPSVQQASPVVMETSSQDNENSSEKKNAYWTGAMDKVFLEQLLQHKSPRTEFHKRKRSIMKTGTQWLTRDQWERISSVIQTLCGVKLDVQQLKNRLKFWRKKIKALIGLQKETGFKWNKKNQTFTASARLWSNHNKKNKDALYWMKHEVTPLHEEIAKWMGEKLSTGKNIHLTREAHADTKDGGPKNVEAANCEYDLLQQQPGQDEVRDHGHGNDHQQLISASGNSAAHLNRIPISNKQNSEGRERFDRISIPLNRIACSIEKMVSLCEKEDNLPQRILEALGKLLDIDSEAKLRAMAHFLDNPKHSLVFLLLNDEEKIEFLRQHCLQL